MPSSPSRGHSGAVHSVCALSEVLLQRMSTIQASSAHRVLSDTQAGTSLAWKAQALGSCDMNLTCSDMNLTCSDTDLTCSDMNLTCGDMI